MRALSIISFFTLFCAVLAAGRPPGKDAILLSQVRTLTLRGNRMTTSRRVPAIPQLKCVGPSKRICDLYPIEVMQCTNQGYDYDEEDIQWSCTADLPSEFRLGSTDVVCEGYRHADDPWVLKGSCGVEYRLLLTDEGERRFGRTFGERWSYYHPNTWNILGDVLFWAVFGVVAFVIARKFLQLWFGHGRGGWLNGIGGGWPWGGGGGGGGGGDDDPRGPPPPYTPHAPGFQPKSWFSSSSSGPGFWTGALTGATAGYLMGQRGRDRSSSEFPWTRRSRPAFSPQYDDDPGEGSSASAVRFSSTRPSTGFGSTRRR
ncbi:hypothetical protein VTN31DRAFT_6930 [Thermomyces dupontii]|uniref:uncharacterized protein n=1 Tax=Talaromyces thermophilus TaxID=28565 RepID=UPI003742002C